MLSTEKEQCSKIIENASTEKEQQSKIIENAKKIPPHDYFWSPKWQWFVWNDEWEIFYDLVNFFFSMDEWEVFYDLVNCLIPRKNDFSCKIIFLHECAWLSIISRSIMNVLSIDNNYDGTIKIIFSYMINS